MNPVHKTKCDIYIDGASQGNPGEAGIGAVICEGETVVKNLSRYIGIATNNVAEYMALLFGLQEALIQNKRNINIKTDSELLYKQIIGEYKVKDQTLKLFHALAKHMLAGFREIEITNIPREQNKGADKLATAAIAKRPVAIRQAKSKKLKVAQDEELQDLL